MYKKIEAKPEVVEKKPKVKVVEAKLAKKS